MAKKIKIKDNSRDKDYFTMIPNFIVNHSSHYEQSLYLIMKRVAGETGSCWMTPDSIGKKMGCSGNTVRKNLKLLTKRGWIKKIGQSGKTKPSDVYEIVDLWALNSDFYNKKENSGGEQSKKKVHLVKEKVHQVKIESSPGGNKEDITKEDIYNNIYIYYKEKLKVDSLLTSKAKDKIKARLKTFSKSDLLRAIDCFSKDSWWMEHNSNRGVAWFFHSDDRIDQFLNLKAKSEDFSVPDYAKDWQ